MCSISLITFAEERLLRIVYNINIVNTITISDPVVMIIKLIE